MKTTKLETISAETAASHENDETVNHENEDVEAQMDSANGNAQANATFVLVDQGHTRTCMIIFRK